MSTHLIRTALVAPAIAGTGWALPSDLAGAPAPGGGLAPEDVSPGVIGFLVTLALVLACIPIFRSMTGKLRGVHHRPVPGEVPAHEVGAEVTDAGRVAPGERAPRDAGEGADAGTGVSRPEEAPGVERRTIDREPPG